MITRLRQLLLYLRSFFRGKQLDHNPGAKGPSLGIVAAAFAGELISSFFLGVGADDPLSFATAALGVAIAAVIASYIPARKATQVDPVATLRYQ